MDAVVRGDMDNCVVKFDAFVLISEIMAELIIKDGVINSESADGASVQFLPFR